MHTKGFPSMAWLSVAVTLSWAGWAQSTQSFESKVQPPQLAAPQRGSLAGQYASVDIGAADVSRGGFSLASAFQVPTERGAPLGSLLPAYSPENGLSEWGLGWASALRIERWNAVGTVKYLADNRKSPWGQLELGRDGYWYTQGLQTKIRVEDKGDTWVAFLPDGSQYTFGGAARLGGPKGTFAWYLTSAKTALGAQTLFEYEANASGRLFVKSVRYGLGGSQLPSRIDIVYETLATPFTDYHAGFSVVVDRRVVAVVAMSQRTDTGAFQQRWRHECTYTADALGPAFFLSEVTQVFASGERAPTVKYAYSKAVDFLNAASFSEVPKLAVPMQERGPEVFLPTQSTVVDANHDGRPDFENNFSQQLYIQEDVGFRREDLPPAPGDVNSWCRTPASDSNPTRLLADLANTGSLQVLATGDSDFVTTPVFICNRAGQVLNALTVPGYFELGPTTRFADVNNDNRPDLVRYDAGRYTVIPNLSDAAGYRFGVEHTGVLTPAYEAKAMWLQDMNGDGVADIVGKFAEGVPYVWFGLGNFEFVEAGQAFSLTNTAGQPAWSVEQYDFTFVDFNKDGLTDILATLGADTVFLLNAGGRFQEWRFPAQWFFSSASAAVVADFVGDGNTHLTAFAYNGGYKAYSVPLDAPGTALLASADDGKGTTVSFTYTRSAPVPGARQRQAVLDTVTVASAGQDSVTSAFSYSAPKLHSLGRFLLGFEGVVKRSPHAREVLSFAFSDAHPGLLLTAETTDDLTPQVVGFETHTYRDMAAFGLTYKALDSVVSGLRSAGGGLTSKTETVITEYDEALCPSKTLTTSVHGTLTTQRQRAAPAQWAKHLHCLESSVSYTGTHAISAFNFTLQGEVSRNDLGQVTALTSVTPAERLSLQTVTYNTDGTPAAMATAGQGTTEFEYDTVTRQLSGVVEPSGVKTTATRDVATGFVTQLSVNRGGTQFSQFFAFDGQERLLKQWNSLGAATETTPNQSFEYRYADALRPGNAGTTTLVDKLAGVSRKSLTLTNAAGETLAEALQTPRGWALGPVRQASKVTGLVTAGVRPSVDGENGAAALTFAQLFSSLSQVSATQSAALGMVSSSHTFHSDVTQVLASSYAVGPAGLVQTTLENGSLPVTRVTDSGKATVSFATQAGQVYQSLHDALGRLRRVTLPDGNTHTVDFDGHGRVSQVLRSAVAKVNYAYQPGTGLLQQQSYASAGGVPVRNIVFAYDAIGRIRAETHSDVVTGNTATFSYWYDGATPGNAAQSNDLGQLSAVQGPGFEKTFTHRPDGSALTQTLQLSGFRKLTRSFDYFDDGTSKSEVTTLLNETGQVLAQHAMGAGVDSVGRVAQLTLNGQTLATQAYDDNGLLTGAAFASGESVTLSYDAATRVLQGFRQARGGLESSVSRRFSNRGSPAHESFVLQGQTLKRGYALSPEGFLASATDEGVGATGYSYTFDAVGFPTGIQSAGVLRKVEGAWPALTVGGVPYRFDALGRISQKGPLTYAYAPTGQVDIVNTGAQTFSFVHDETGQRLLKRSGSGETTAFWNDVTVDASGLTQALSVGGLVVGLVKNGSFSLVPTDFKGTVVAGVDGVRNLSAPHGERAVPVPSSVALDYVTKGFDADLGTYRMGVRDYDATAGIFLSADPLFLERPEKCVESPLECNLYGYAKGNPSRFTDGSGLQASEDEGVVAARKASGMGGLGGVRATQQTLEMVRPVVDGVVEMHPVFGAYTAATGKTPSGAEASTEERVVAAAPLGLGVVGKLAGAVKGAAGWFGARAKAVAGFFRREGVVAEGVVLEGAAARGAGVAEREATGFLGSRRAPLPNAPYQPLRNGDAVIGGRTFGGHALDQMQNRGLIPSVVENAIQTGMRSPDPIVGRFRFFDAVNKFTVITEGERVVTVIPGRLR